MSPLKLRGGGGGSYLGHQVQLVSYKKMIFTPTCAWSRVRRRCRWRRDRWSRSTCGGRGSLCQGTASATKHIYIPNILHPQFCFCFLWVYLVKLNYLALGPLSLDIVLPEISLFFHARPTLFLVNLDKIRLYHHIQKIFISKYFCLTFLINTVISVNQIARPEDLRPSHNLLWYLLRPHCQCRSARSD